MLDDEHDKLGGQVQVSASKYAGSHTAVAAVVLEGSRVRLCMLVVTTNKTPHCDRPGEDTVALKFLRGAVLLRFQV